MSWLDSLSDEQRAEMQAINANLNHTRVSKSGARYFRCENGQVIESDRPSAVVPRSMFPYYSSAMAVDPSEIETVQEQLRRQGVLAEFDKQGRPIITSAKQHAALATAMGMKTGRDGYGHTDEYGNFQNSGRRRNDEIQSGRNRVRKAREKLLAMPENVMEHAIRDVLDEYDISPTEENTG